MNDQKRSHYIDSIWGRARSQSQHESKCSVKVADIDLWDPLKCQGLEVNLSFAKEMENDVKKTIRTLCFRIKARRIKLTVLFARTTQD